MKHNILIINLLLVILLFTSCEDFLKDEPESVMTSVDFYTTPERIEGGIMGCYFGMKAVIDYEWIYTELRSDNTCVAQVNSGSSERTYQASSADFSIDPSEPDLLDYWYYTFQNISNINNILPSVLDNAYITSEEVRAQYEAELRFIRAHHYFTLVTLFGDMFKVTDVIGPDEALNIMRSPVSEVYNEIIIPDLKIAAEGAPSSYAGDDKGRITKWAAKGLLAKAYMQLGGSENLALAKTLLEEFVIAENSPHGLLSTGIASVFDITNEMNSEIIFAIRFKGVSGNGSPFFEEFAAADKPYFPIGNSGGQGNNNPTFELMSQFASDPADSRNDLVGVFAASRNYPYHLKYQDWGLIDGDYGENDWIVLRYADIVLLYAEVLAQDGNYGEAHTYVNEIRERAGKALVAAPFASQTMALDSVYHERKLELAFENHRWFDLLRMNTSYNNPNKAMDILTEHTFVTDWGHVYRNYQKIDVPVESNYINERLLLPVPQDEIDANNGVIYQNPSY